MATFFRNSLVKNVGTVPITAVTTGANARATVIGLSLANLTENAVTASITVSDSTSISAYYIKDVLVPPNSSLRVINGGEKLMLSTLNSMEIFSNQDDALDAIVSYVEII
jgi:hypothetical protein